MYKIKVCLPFYKDYETAWSGLNELEACTEHEFVIREIHGTDIGRTRNALPNDGISQEKHQKIQGGFTHILDVDSDIGFTLDDVLVMLKHDKDIVGLPYLRQADKTNTEYECHRFTKGLVGNIDSYYTIHDKGLQEVPSQGNGMRLSKVHVYEKMEYPWYRQRLISNGTIQDLCAVDIGFSLGARFVGFKQYCDFDRAVYHKKRTLESFNWRK